MTRKAKAKSKVQHPEGHPENATVRASVTTAQAFVDGGQTVEQAAEWLARQCPDDFKDAAEAAESLKPAKSE